MHNKARRFMTKIVPLPNLLFSYIYNFFPQNLGRVFIQRIILKEYILFHKFLEIQSNSK